MNAKEQIFEYLQPDITWKYLGIKSQEDFMHKLITKGKFHKNVPEVIQKDYQLVEQLQFYSYYNYALIDEALGKSTRIFEASIDLKIADLGIEKKGFESLNSKINRLENYSSNELHKQWMHSKELRNLFAHHKAGRLMGSTLFKLFKHINNMINSVFLQKKEIIEKENSLKKIIAESKHIKKGLFIMEYNKNRYLIWSMIPHTSSNRDEIEKSFWVFHPVYGENKIKEISDFPKPLKLNLKNLKINKDGLSGSVIETNEAIRIVSTKAKVNVEKYERHNEQMINLDLDLKKNISLYWRMN